MQGVFINGRRPTSKKEIKEILATTPEIVVLEATSLYGNEYGGPIKGAPNGTYYFVGPDPYYSRKFYGTIKVIGERIIAS